ncbi:MAG: RagB/SusD family nutrient uptake outer membrane protein [Candidatus Cryptobacteroides sp.]
MKRNIIVKAVSALALCAAAVSCNFLDIDPVDSFNEKVVFGNLETLDGYVTKRYSEIWDPLDRRALRFACDESMNNFNWGGQNNAQQGYLHPDNDCWLGTWWSYYSVIQNCNLFMDKIEEIELLKVDDRSTALVDQYIGEIRFIRAFCYADLISRYGGVILSTTAFKVDMDDEEIFLPRSSYEDCVDFIVGELDLAAEALPLQYDAKWLGRASKGAALALKARVLLYAASPLNNVEGDIRKWQAAKKATEDVIFLNTDGTVDENSGIKIYSLDPDYYGLFRNPKSSEIIFEKIFSSEFGHYFDQYNSPNGFTGWSETCVNQLLVDSYEIAATGELPKAADLYGDKNGKEYEIGTTPWQGRDPRFYATIACDGDRWKTRDIEYYLIGKQNDKGKWDVTSGGRDSNKGGIEEWNASATGFYCKKFTTESIGVSFNDKSNVPWIYFRLGELYLNYAEILFNLGDEAGAKKYLEKVRERARGGDAGILPEVTASGDELWKAIMRERRVELAFEEHRFFDMRRWALPKEDFEECIYGVIIYKNPDTGKKTYVRNQTLKTSIDLPKQYLFAIPNSERQKNPLLEQNPGYPN